MDSPTIGIAPERISLAKHVAHTERSGICRIDQDHLASHHVGNRSSKEWVVRATKQQRIDTGIYEWRQKSLSENVNLL
jgi:hypothetical protein